MQKAAGFFRRLGGILRPITIGIVLAFLLNPIYHALVGLFTAIARQRASKPRVGKLIRLFAARSGERAAYFAYSAPFAAILRCERSDAPCTITI